MHKLCKRAALGALLLVPLAACQAGGARDASPSSAFNTAGYRENVDDAYSRGDISAERAYDMSKRADKIDRAGEPTR